MSRTIKTAIWSGIGLIAILVLCIIVLLTFDWNRAKPWLSGRISEATGRPFAINGSLSVTWHRSPSEAPGWSKLLPWPRLNAENVTFGNPSWVKAARNMAEIRHIAFSVNPLALLQHDIAIPALTLDQPKLNLQRAADGKNNWTLNPDRPFAWEIKLERLRFDHATVHIVDAIKHADVKADIDPPGKKDREGDQMSWKLSGTFNGAAVSGNGKAGSMLLQKNAQSFPITADLSIGKTFISVDGTVNRPHDLAVLDMRLRLSGSNMAQLSPIIGVLLPETSAFTTEGRLTATLSQKGGDWKYGEFKGRVGASDLAGSLVYHATQRRPHLSGELVSHMLRLEDLTPLIGADSRTSRARRGFGINQSTDKVLPVQAFRTDLWTSIDADIRINGHKIIRDKAATIHNLVADLQLKDGVLSLAPLTFGMAGGNLVSSIRLDGREKTIKAEMTISARHLELKQLFPRSRSVETSAGEINGDASLSATGNSIAAMLGSVNGELKMLMNRGAVSRQLLKQTGLNVASSVLTELFGDEQVRINCLAGDFTMTDGLMEPRVFAIDTEQSLLLVDGRIDMVNERLDLSIDPRRRDLRLISLRSPVYVTGSFKSPKVVGYSDTPAVKTDSLITLDSLMPVAAALLPLINQGSEQDSGCNSLLPDIKTLPTPALPAQQGTAGRAYPTGHSGKQISGLR